MSARSRRTTLSPRAMRKICISGSTQFLGQGDHPKFSTQPNILLRPVQTEVTRTAHEPITQTYEAAPTVDMVTCDAFLTRDEFQTSLAKERVIYGVSLQNIMLAQVEKLQEAVTAEVTKLNVRMDKLASAQQSDISSEILQQFNVRMDQMGALIKKYANDSESFAQQTDARIEKNAKDLLELVSIGGRKQAKNTEDILKMEAALESIMKQTDSANEPCANAVSGVMDQLNALAESYQGRVNKLEASELRSAKSLEDLVQENHRLQQNDDALQQQYECLRQQLDQRRGPLDDNAGLIVRMADLEESMLQLRCKEYQNEFEREVHQLLQHLSKHLESYESRLCKLECGGISAKLGHVELVDALLPS